MLKLGVYFEEKVILFVEGKEISIKVEYRGSKQVGLIFDAPKEVKIVREKIIKHHEAIEAVNGESSYSKIEGA